MTVDGKVIHSSERWADAAITFLHRQAEAAKTNPKAKPFFMHVAFHAPHDPRQCPKEFLDLYPREKVAIPPNYLPEHPFDQGDSRVRDEVLAPFPRTEDAVRLHRQEYYAILSHVDQQIGRILDTLDATGQSGNTLVMFSSDHGLAVGQHGLMGKQNLYDHSIRIPLLFAGPGIPAGKQRDALVYQSSLFPTACDLCGLPIPRTVEHRSLATLVRSGKGKGYETLYGGYRDLQRMVRDKEWKLIVYLKAGKTQLFNLQHDPWEQHNLAADPQHQPLIAELKTRLRQWQKDLDDAHPIA
jgi:arylsulfatase A-like enzyme